MTINFLHCNLKRLQIIFLVFVLYQIHTLAYADVKDTNETFIVSFNTMGGTPVKSVAVTGGERLTEPDDPSKDSYYCDAWYKDQDYNEVWNFNTDVVTGDMVLYAHWEAEDFPVDNRIINEGQYVDYFQTPLNYDEPHNSTRKYPLIIGLHGAGGSQGYAPIGDNLSESKAHPAFLFSPVGWDNYGVTLPKIKQVVENYRIDTSRIYVVGFSMGGSGSYPFADALYNQLGIITAAIFRSAGGSKPELDVPLLRQTTSIWYEIGLDDDPDRVKVADNAFSKARNYPENASAVYSEEHYTIKGKPVYTQILTQDGVRIMLLSRITNVGHTTFLPWELIETHDWLFSQNLNNRMGTQLIENFTVSPDVVKNNINTDLVFSLIPKGGAVLFASLNLSAIGGGANVPMTTNGSAFRYTYQLASGVTPGTYSVSVTAENSGGVIQTRQVSLTIVAPSQTKPEIKNAMVDPTQIYNFRDNQIKVSATVTDALGTIKSVKVNLTSVGGGNSVEMNKSGNNYSYTYTVPSGLSKGDKDIPILAESNNGNTTSESVSLRINEAEEDELIIYNDAKTIIKATWIGDPDFSLSEIKKDQGAYEGENHYQFNCKITDNWANFGLNFTNWNGPGIDFSGYKSLQFACKYSGASDVSVILMDTDGNYDEVEIAGVSAQYKVFTIPLNEFSGVTMEDIMEIRVSFGGIAVETGVFYMDDIRVIPESAPGPDFSVSPSSISIEKLSGSEGTFSISGPAWTVSTQAPWLDLSPVSGTGDVIVTVTANAENTADDDRYATITVKANGYSDLTVNVTQWGAINTGVEPDNLSKITVYPNPAQSKLTIQSPEAIHITMTDLGGSVLIKRTGIFDTSLDISSLKSGLYLLRIESKDGVSFKKFIKNH